MTTTPHTRYRSRDWFDTPELYGWLRRAAFKAEGFGEPAYEGRPIIGICNSWSELTHCNAHLRQVAEVKRGVWQAGDSRSNSPSCRWGNTTCARPCCIAI